MSCIYAGSFDRLTQGLNELAGIEPRYRTTAEKRQALTVLSTVIARAEAERLRVLAVADDIAVETGDRSVASWLATETRDHPGTLRRHAALAEALDTRWSHTASAFAAGSVNLAQARIIADALDALPRSLAASLIVRAEELLVHEAGHLGPRDLRTYADRILEHLAPDIAEAAEYDRLLAEERRADAETRLSMRRRGDGSTDIRARVSDVEAARLGAYLDAFNAPRRRHLGDQASEAVDELAQLPLERQRGIAFVALLERVLVSSLPRHGGTATSVMVTLDYGTLIREHGRAGVATTSTGHRVTAGEARRLACQAGIIPVVLGGGSEILDVGRTRRLVTDAIRKALNLRDRGCTAAGCTMPPALCEAHHVIPWSRGGPTSLADSKLLCSFHHHRAHDPDWETRHPPDGSTTFHRRT